MIQDLRDLYVVSDGGAVDDHGSYGWVIGLSNGTCLAQGHGVVYGHDPCSYRAEGYGAKASALFLWNLFQYCKHAIPDAAEDGGFIFHCDNEGLLKKLALFRQYENARQATCLHSEWDIVSSINLIHAGFFCLPKLVHVKGHQDDNHMPKKTWIYQPK
jgi:hypothetical protein